MGRDWCAMTFAPLSSSIEPGLRADRPVRLHAALAAWHHSPALLSLRACRTYPSKSCHALNSLFLLTANLMSACLHAGRRAAQEGVCGAVLHSPLLCSSLIMPACCMQAAQENVCAAAGRHPGRRQSHTCMRAGSTRRCPCHCPLLYGETRHLGMQAGSMRRCLCSCWTTFCAVDRAGPSSTASYFPKHSPSCAVPASCFACVQAAREDVCAAA